MKENGCAGETAKGTRFYFSWIKDTFLLLSMVPEELELIEAFAAIVEYRPFCRYTTNSEDGTEMITFEWDKKDSQGRFVELQKERKENLQPVE
ncbi:MAG: hypothetical protein ACNFW9_05340 [Candidatus Kerfeldbacteria bacterium]